MIPFLCAENFCDLLGKVNKEIELKLTYITARGVRGFDLKKNPTTFVLLQSLRSEVSIDKQTILLVEMIHVQWIRIISVVYIIYNFSDK